MSGAAIASNLPAGPHVPTAGGRVNLSAYSDSDGPVSVVILTGAIGDYGKARRETSTGSKAQDDELDVALKRGSFVLDIAGIENKLLQAIDAGFPTDASTCSGLVTVDGAAPIVAGSGTGAYSSLQGFFHLTIAINEVETWPSCPKTDTAPYLAQSVFISGSGSVSLK
jgi:hypothetical protein